MLNKLYLNIDNLLYNFNLVKRHNKNSKICAMVKANAYGHGIKEIVSTLNAKADFFGVNCVDEAKKVKQYTKTKILIVGPLCNFVFDGQFSYTCCCVEDIKYLAKLNKKIDIHIKINSGMNRFGFSNVKKLKHALNIIKNSRINLEGIFTHFASADNFVKVQYKRFKRFVAIARKFGFNPLVHADNSAVNFKHNHLLDMVRVGYSLYGAEKPFKPVMSLYGRVEQINFVKTGEQAGYSKRFVASAPTNIAVVSLGYADGLDLNSIGLDLMIFNQPCKIVNVCMDCFMLDIKNLAIKKGDYLSVVGKDNTFNKFAEHLHSTAYQVMCHFGWARADRKLISSPATACHKHQKQQPYK